MTTLTKLEKQLIEKATKQTDGSNSFCFYTAENIGEQLGWSINTTKGVYGSLVEKNIVEMTDDILEDGKDGRDDRVAYWSMSVCLDDDDGIELINTVEKIEKFLTERGVA